MNNILDNPIWSALVADNHRLSEGNDAVKYFLADVAPFAALQVDSQENYQYLFDMISDDRILVIFSPRNDLNVSPWILLDIVAGYQMVFEKKNISVSMDNEAIVRLAEKNVPEMLALTTLVPPGPFFDRTIEFGGYKGIFSDGKLVAMAGQRLRSGVHTEISAVCTNPNHGGNGYARKLVNDQIADIITSGNIPYLHVRADNVIAKDLYLRMGFTIRSEMNFYVLKKS